MTGKATLHDRPIVIEKAAFQSATINNGMHSNPFGESPLDAVNLGVQKGIVEGIAAVFAKAIFEISSKLGSYLISKVSSNQLDTDRAALKVAISAGECSKILDESGEPLKKALLLIEDKSERDDFCARALFVVAKCRKEYLQLNEWKEKEVKLRYALSKHAQIQEETKESSSDGPF